MFRSSVPVGFSNSQPAVCGLHVSSSVDAWSTCRRTKLIENMLPNLLLRIDTMTDEKFLKLFVGNQPANKVINNCGQCVVTADSFVERLLLGPDHYCRRQQQRKDQG